MEKIKHGLCLFFALFVLMTTAVFAGFTPVNTVLAAENSENNFDDTAVTDDLSEYDLSQFAYDKNGSIQFVTLAEYCFSASALNMENYALYVYIYNPARLAISERQGANTVNMAIAYDEDGNPCDYANVPLKLCGIATGDYSKLLYKFRIIDEDGAILRNARTHESDNGYRRYDIAGIQLWETGADNARDYGVGGTYKFTGYAKGYGTDQNAENNLLCSVEELETVKLNVRHTYYRTKTSSKGAGYQNQLDTVYFAVPKRLFDTYGKLQRIKAEWYEYKTKDIVVTSNQDFYDKAYPWLGRQTGAFDQFGMTEYNEEIYYSLGQNAGDAGGGMNMAAWGWNLGSGYLHVPAPALYYLFKTDNISEYDPYADIVENGGITSNALYEWIKGYNKTYENGTLPVKDGTISADLFADDIDEYRKIDTQYGKIQKGYSYYDFDADVDLQTLSSWQETDPSFWDNWINWGLWNAMTGNIPQEESRTVAPIYTLKADDLNGTDEEISERLLINPHDVSALRDYYNEAITVDTSTADEEKVVVLFRFATSDYYSAAVDIIELGKGFLWSDKHTSGQAYRAWESVFLDFDIIQLSFQKDGAYTVIPAVSDPIDIVNDITPPVYIPDGLEWWQILLIVLGVIVGLFLLIMFFPAIIGFIGKLIVWIFKGLWWLISAPFRLIKMIIEKIREKRG